MYEKHTSHLFDREKPMKLTPELCKEHYSKHVVNPYSKSPTTFTTAAKCSATTKNIGVKSSHNGNTIEPHHVNEYIKLSRHKLDLVKYMNVMRKQSLGNKQTNTEPYAFHPKLMTI